MLSFTQLPFHLKQKCAPIYLLTGDEPFQLIEAIDSIRKTAQQQGYLERQIIDASGRFDWSELTIQATTMSLFAEKRLIELRMNKVNLGISGSKALIEYCQNLPTDVILLISMPKCNASQKKSKWFKTIDSKGIIVQIWELTGASLVDWIWQRMQAKSLQVTDRQVAVLLATKVEGNLLAAAQEIEKLGLQFPNQEIGLTQLETVEDSAHYLIFGLVDAALMGKIVRALKMLDRLKAEGMASQLVLWVLTKDIRLLASLAYQIQQGTLINQAIAARRDIFQNRQALIKSALQRHSLPYWHRLLSQCSEIDLMIKGRLAGDVWFNLKQTLTAIAIKI